MPESVHATIPLHGSMPARRKVSSHFPVSAHMLKLSKPRRGRDGTGWLDHRLCVAGIPAAGVESEEEVATIRLEVAEPPPSRQLVRCRNTEHGQLDQIHLLDPPIVNAIQQLATHFKEGCGRKSKWQ